MKNTNFQHKYPKIFNIISIVSCKNEENRKNIVRNFSTNYGQCCNIIPQK